jgi:predicted dehydrogenase
MQALAAGKHVLCEKPYSRRPADVTEAFDAAEAAGVVLMEAFMYRHHPQTAVVERLAKDGTLGRLLSIRATFTFALHDLTDVRAKPELDGGALMDVGCYCVSGSRLAAGEPVSASATQVTGPTGIDMALHGTLRFEGDVVAQFEASFLAPRRQFLEIVGEDAVLTVQSPWRVDWPGDVLLTRDDAIERLSIPVANSYARQLDNLAAAVAGEAEPLLGRADALGQARTIESLYAAVASK